MKKIVFGIAIILVGVGLAAGPKIPVKEIIALTPEQLAAKELKQCISEFSKYDCDNWSFAELKQERDDRANRLAAKRELNKGRISTKRPNQSGRDIKNNQRRVRAYQDCLYEYAGRGYSTNAVLDKCNGKYPSHW